jgi:hypothetical protein
MRRREFLGFLGGTATTAWPLTLRAQQAVPVVGFLSGRSPGEAATALGACRQGLGDVGYIDGKNFTIEYRRTEGRYGRLPALAAELVKALAACKKQKAKLVIAKLDRLSRNLAFIAALMDSGVEFTAVDNPHANKLTIHILAAVAFMKVGTTRSPWRYDTGTHCAVRLASLRLPAIFHYARGAFFAISKAGPAITLVPVLGTRYVVSCG